MTNNDIKMDFSIHQNGIRLVKARNITLHEAMKRIDTVVTKKIGANFKGNKFYMAPMVFYSGSLVYLLEVKNYLGL